jgi:hypothetical protein
MSAFFSKKLGAVPKYGAYCIAIAVSLSVIGGCPLQDGNGDVGSLIGGDQAGQQQPDTTGGTDGTTGPQGPAGPQGSSGPQGQSGPQGPAGPQGEQGATGPQGPAGEDGQDGVDGQAGLAGISCWDLNMNGIGDPDEDINLDGSYNAFDCQNLPGPAGVSCWDLNMNGQGDPGEDINLDGNFDALDCRGTQGPQGISGLDCWDLNGNGVADPVEDINLDGNFDALDCHGADGLDGLDGQDGLDGKAGLPCWDLNGNGIAELGEDQNGDGFFDADDCRGEQGDAGLPCWDFNGNGIADLEEDINSDGTVDVYDCRGGVAFAGVGLVQDGDIFSVDFGLLDSSYWTLGGNDANGGEVLGTLTSLPFDLVAGGARTLRLIPHAFSPSIVGGHSSNSVAPSVAGATIAGGGSPDDGTGTPAPNTVSGDFATVGGGLGNTASGTAATVPGGFANEATGDNSFAAGFRAHADHPGSFVFADGTDEDYATVRDDEFRVRAHGGIRFDMGPLKSFEIRAYNSRFIHTSTNGYLSLGGSWVNGSNRETKSNFASVDGKQVLQQVVGLPIETWNYNAEDPTIRHMGPMAQDFYATFGIGYDDESIATIDANGVALAAIQGLNTLHQEQAIKIAAQQTEIDALQTQVSQLEARLAAIEALLNKNNAKD